MNCKTCGAELKTIPAGVSKKTGRPYQSFTACPNGCKNSWSNPTPNAPERPITSENKRGGEIIVLEEIKAVSEKIDKMWDYIFKKLS